MKDLPTGTVTFLFTDIEGSTNLLQRLGDKKYAELLAEHQRFLRAAFANGHEIDTQGDAFLVAFSSAKDALATAVTAQQALTKHPWPDGASLRVRMGLHTGEPVAAADRYVGLDVHRASRICSAGHGGQILLSQTVADLTTSDLPPGVGMRDLGIHRLKDLREPEHLFQVVHPDLPADFPPLKALDARPNNLPIQLTSFIGREKEIAEVKRLLSISYLVTLTGSGGAGKTRLALEVAAEILDDYPDGVWLVELAPISDPVLVPKTVASAMNVPEQPSRDMTETLVDAVRPKALLLVLDNCEHVVAACADLAVALLRACPQVRLLATSREGLGAPGETLWRVPSLSLPGDIRDLPPPEELVLYDAVRLFVDRAVVTAPGFTVTTENAPAVAQVCQRLDGIPLAIELAAARVKVLAVEQIAIRLDDRFRLLTGGSRTVVLRQQTLRATMDWSYGLLTEREQALLRRLSVFAGGWTVEAMEAVCAGAGIETASILDLLTSLADKSLVIAEIQGGEARYRLLETVRQYADEQLRNVEERTEVQRRHYCWFLSLAERAEPEQYGANQGTWMDRLEVERDNLRAALAWSVVTPEGRQQGLRMAVALIWFWLAGADWTEGLGWLEEGLRYNDHALPSTRAAALGGAAGFAWRLEKDQQAIAFAEEGLALCKETGDQEHGAWCLCWLGNVAMQQGDYLKAKRLDEEMFNMCSGLEHKAITCMALNDLGEATRYLGDYEAATGFHDRGISLARKFGHLFPLANLLRHLGMDHVRRGNYSRAADSYRESLGLCRKVKSKWIAVECLNGLGDIASIEDQCKRAARLFGAAGQARETLGVRPILADQQYHDQCIAVTRDRLGASVFATALAEGRAMTLEQAIEYALSEKPTERPEEPSIG